MLRHINTANVFLSLPKHSNDHKILRIYETIVHEFERKERIAADFLVIVKAIGTVTRWLGLQTNTF